MLAPVTLSLFRTTERIPCRRGCRRCSGRKKNHYWDNSNSVCYAYVSSLDQFRIIRPSMSHLHRAVDAPRAILFEGRTRAVEPILDFYPGSLRSPPLSGSTRELFFLPPSAVFLFHFRLCFLISFSIRPLLFPSYSFSLFLIRSPFSTRFRREILLIADLFPIRLLGASERLREQQSTHTHPLFWNDSPSHRMPRLLVWFRLQNQAEMATSCSSLSSARADFCCDAWMKNVIGSLWRLAADVTRVINCLH